MNVSSIRSDFPILSQKIHGKELVYLDNAASTQKPKAVIDEIARFLSEDYSNIHRGVHELSQRATVQYEAARVKAQTFIGAESNKEIIFVRGTTEAVNLVAATFGRTNVKAGDNLVITAMEHHSNIVPWQLLCDEVRAELRVARMNSKGELDLDHFESLLDEKTRIASVVHVSNALGTINPVKKLIEIAHHRGVPVFLDGAQAVPHIQVDVQELDVDFYAFSSHKIYGPSGVGVLYGKLDHLKNMPPYHGGGEMIQYVSFEKSTFKQPPFRFEAGTPNITGAVGFAKALTYVSEIGLDRIAEHEDRLLKYGSEKLSKIPGVRLIGTADRKAAVLSFVMESAHPHDIGTILDQEGVAIRAGHHCAQPVMQFFDVPATARASIGIYNTEADIDRLVAAVGKVQEIFGS